MVDPSPKWVAIIESKPFLILAQDPGFDDRINLVYQSGRIRVA